LRPSVLTALAVVLATPSLAHGPTPLKVDETVTIAADPRMVWALVGSFGAIAKWHPDIKSVQVTGGDALGGERILTFQNGATLKESLDEFDPSSLKYSYRMLDPNLEALPVSSYSMTLAVRTASSGGSEVEWYGRIYRGDTGNEPPDNLNDDAARQAVGAFLRNGLQGLKSKLESKWPG